MTNNEKRCIDPRFLLSNVCMVFVYLFVSECLVLYHFFFFVFFRFFCFVFGFFFISKIIIITIIITRSHLFTKVKTLFHCWAILKKTKITKIEKFQIKSTDSHTHTHNSIMPDAAKSIATSTGKFFFVWSNFSFWLLLIDWILNQIKSVNDQWSMIMVNGWKLFFFHRKIFQKEIIFPLNHTHTRSPSFY